MNNDTTGINEQPESKTQESPMPSDEQKIDQPSEVDTTSQETEEVGSTESGEDTLPDNTSDRTRDQFDKLRNQLREERSRREYLEGVYQSMQTQKQEQVPEQPIYDPETGLLNEQALTDIQKRALAAEQRAERAEQSVKQYSGIILADSSLNGFREAGPVQRDVLANPFGRITEPSDDPAAPVQVRRVHGNRAGHDHRRRRQNATQLQIPDVGGE